MSNGRRARYPSSEIIPDAAQTIWALIERGHTRRTFLKSLFALPLFAGTDLLGLPAHAQTNGFRSVPLGRADAVVVPSNYVATAILPWGDPIHPGGPRWNGSKNTAQEQEQQIGMHHDGLQFFPLTPGNSTRGLLAINHEYVSPMELLGATQIEPLDSAHTSKAMAAVGMSVVEIELQSGVWRPVANSKYSRRISGTANFEFSGPAVGLLPKRSSGTWANCGSGITPWGTYLSCEEDSHNRQKSNQPADEIGWVIELDPYDPSATPTKRTAMGRMEHENAAHVVAKDNRVVFYMGNDNRFECIYKFVTAKPYTPGNAALNRNLLDSGTLYVAKFEADGVGRWIAMQHNTGALTAANGFPSQAYVLAHAGKAGRTLGGTPMDRPEWMAVHPLDKSVYVALSFNQRRGESGQKPVDSANPRRNNLDGHIIRFVEDKSDPLAETFRWEIFLLAGSPAFGEAARIGNIRGDSFSCPDTVAFDALGRLWVASSYGTDRPEYAAQGNSSLFLCDTASRAVKRFMVGPPGCEITGFTTTPDLKTAFVNVQHPGEGGIGTSHWPHGDPSRPARSATVVIQKSDGGVIGS